MLLGIRSNGFILPYTLLPWKVRDHPQSPLTGGKLFLLIYQIPVFHSSENTFLPWDDFLCLGSRRE